MERLEKQSQLEESRFAHEANHMLDFTHLNNGSLLSETLRFRRVYNLYEEAVESILAPMMTEVYSVQFKLDVLEYF